MDAVTVLKELKEEITVKIMPKHSAPETEVFKTATEIIAIIDAKISELGGE